MINLLANHDPAGLGLTLTLVALGIAVGGCREPTSNSADLVVTGARVWTGDDQKPWAEAVASLGDTIVAVGSSEEVEHWVGPETKVINVPGSFLVPGFIDAHLHFLTGGSGLASVQLRDAKTRDEFADRLRGFAETLQPGEWILDGAWDHQNWGGELPDRRWIDEVTPKNPVFVMRLDGHMGLANSYALELAGVDGQTPDVEGGDVGAGPRGPTHWSSQGQRDELGSRCCAGTYR